VDAHPGVADDAGSSLRNAKLALTKICLNSHTVRTLHRSAANVMQLSREIHTMNKVVLNVNFLLHHQRTNIQNHCDPRSLVSTFSDGTDVANVDHDSSEEENDRDADDDDYSSFLDIGEVSVKKSRRKPGQSNLCDEEPQNGPLCLGVSKADLVDEKVVVVTNLETVLILP
jgi:hypothetical protein